MECPRLYAHTETKELERKVVRIMLRHLHDLGIEGNIGTETIQYQGEFVEMCFIEYNPPSDWVYSDVELLAQQISEKMSKIC